MAQKKHDNKNRILCSGESQQKDGRYVNKYADALEKPRKASKDKRPTVERFSFFHTVPDLSESRQSPIRLF